MAKLHSYVELELYLNGQPFCFNCAHLPSSLLNPEKNWCGEVQCDLANSYMTLTVRYNQNIVRNLTNQLFLLLSTWSIEPSTQRN